MTKIFLIRDRKAFSTKWLCEFAIKLDNLGYNTSIICNEKKHSPQNDITINSKINKINLHKYSGFFSPFKFKRYIEKESPDICFAYFIKDLFNLSLCLNKTKVIMMMHNPPIEVFNKFNPIKRFICKILLHRVACIQVLMPEFEQQIKNFIGNNIPIEVIPNQVMIKEEIKNYNIENKVIIHVAQIAEYNKRQHLLITAFSKIAHKYPDWKIYFFGQVKDGKHKTYYKKCISLIKFLGLEQQIIFKGFSKNITQDYLNADINTLPSRSEGFGYGLADGLALGLPSIGFVDSAAINQIIQDNKSGYLITDVDDYANKLDILMSDKFLRQQLGEFGKKDMQARYSPEVVINMWYNLIERLIK